MNITEPSAVPALQAHGLQRYEDYVGCSVGEVVHRSTTSETRRLTLSCAEAVPGHGRVPEVFFLKVYRYTGRHRRRAWRAEKAGIEARNYAIMRERCGVNTPAVVACGHRRRGSRLVDGFILTRGVPDAKPLEEYLPPPAAGREPRDAGLRRFLLGETADIAARMHAAGFYHVDLQWRNLLVAGAAGARPAVYVLDSSRGGLRRHRLRQEHGRLRDLSSLYKMARSRLDRREQVRWLRRYFGVRRLGPEHRVLVQTILYDRSVKDDGTA